MSGETGAIVGRVVTLDGEPIAGARAWAEWLGGDGFERVQATTDESGRYRIEGTPVDARCFLVWAESPAHARERVENVVRFAGRDVDVGTLALAPGARLEGRVLLASGEPAPNARVEIECWHHSHGHSLTWSGPGIAVSCDADGRFVTPPLPVGMVHVAIRSPGRASLRDDRIIAPGERRISLGEVRLGDVRVVSGVVVDDAGRGVPGALVRAGRVKAVTDDAGRFELCDVSDCDASMDVHASGFDVWRGTIDSATREMRIPLASAAEIRGVVIDAETKRPVGFELLHLCRVEVGPDGSKRLYG
jgi:hypothetical protein